MTALRKVWAWLKRWWKVVVPIVGAAVAVGVGAVLAAGAYERKVASLRDAIEVERAQRRIAELRGQRQVLMEEDAKDEARVLAIDTELEENRQVIAAARARANVPDDELEEEFRRLGY